MGRFGIHECRSGMSAHVFTYHLLLNPHKISNTHFTELHIYYQRFIFPPLSLETNETSRMKKRARDMHATPALFTPSISETSHNTSEQQIPPYESFQRRRTTSSVFASLPLYPPSPIEPSESTNKNWESAFLERFLRAASISEEEEVEEEPSTPMPLPPTPPPLLLPSTTLPPRRPKLNCHPTRSSSLDGSTSSPTTHSLLPHRDSVQRAARSDSGVCGMASTTATGPGDAKCGFALPLPPPPTPLGSSDGSYFFMSRNGKGGGEGIGG